MAPQTRAMLLAALVALPALAAAASAFEPHDRPIENGYLALQALAASPDAPAPAFRASAGDPDRALVLAVDGLEEIDASGKVVSTRPLHAAPWVFERAPLEDALALNFLLLEPGLQLRLSARAYARVHNVVDPGALRGVGAHLADVDVSVDKWKPANPDARSIALTLRLATLDRADLGGTGAATNASLAALPHAGGLGVRLAQDAPPLLTFFPGGAQATATPEPAGADGRVSALALRLRLDGEAAPFAARARLEAPLPATVRPFATLAITLLNGGASATQTATVTDVGGGVAAQVPVPATGATLTLAPGEYRVAVPGARGTIERALTLESGASEKVEIELGGGASGTAGGPAGGSKTSPGAGAIFAIAAVAVVALAWTRRT